MIYQIYSRSKVQKYFILTRTIRPHLGQLNLIKVKFSDLAKNDKRNKNPVIFYNDPNFVKVQPIVDQPAAILPAAILPVNTEEEQLNTETISQNTPN